MRFLCISYMVSGIWNYLLVLGFPQKLKHLSIYFVDYNIVFLIFGALLMF